MPGHALSSKILICEPRVHLGTVHMSGDSRITPRGDVRCHILEVSRTLQVTSGFLPWILNRSLLDTNHTYYSLGVA